MNERVMQFRIGIFVIVAGLVLATLIIWFGESPSLLRGHNYIRVRYSEAPGVAEGIPVRRSGIRVGEVTAILFDEQPNTPDSVLVTLSLERGYKFKEGTVPRLSRSLFGDVAIDLLPGKGTALLKTSDAPTDAPVIDGVVAPDPSKAMEAATLAFQKAGDTLKSIDLAANGISEVSKSARKLDEFITTWQSTGQRVQAAADGIDRFIRANEAEIGPTVTNLRAVSAKLNTTLDGPTQESFRTGMRQFSIATKQLSASLDQAAPLFRDLGAPVNGVPQTDFGQTIRRVNRISSDVGLLTQTLRAPDGSLNKDGSVQKLMMKPEVYDNINRMALSGSSTFDGFKPLIAALRVFADKISRDPSILAKGALQR